MAAAAARRLPTGTAPHPQSADFLPRRARRGFTLLELAVVLFLVGLVMMLVMPYFGSIQGAQLRSEARRLASRSNYLYQEAGTQKVLLRLNFDLDRNSYFVTRLDPFAGPRRFVAETGPAGERVVLSGGVRLRDVWVQGAGDFTHGVIGAQFYPGGYADATVIHLSDQRGEVFTLAIDPLSGHVEIVRGDLNQAALARLS